MDEVGTWGDDGDFNPMAMMMKAMGMDMQGNALMNGGGGDWGEMPSEWAMKAAMKLQGGEKLCKGRVRCYQAEKKFGFISCKEVYEAFTQEVFAYENFLAQASAGPGDYVLFSPRLNDKGQP